MHKGKRSGEEDGKRGESEIRGKLAASRLYRRFLINILATLLLRNKLASFSPGGEILASDTAKYA